MLRHYRDIQSLLYMIAQPLLVVCLWNYGFSWLLYALLLLLSIGIGTVNHNHAHLPFWRWGCLNRLTDLWLTTIQGHPTFVFQAGHIANHHRHHHGKNDIARTYRFGGDTNNLLGYLTHPLCALWVSYPHFAKWLGRLWKHRPANLMFCLLQYFIVVALWTGLALIDWQKWLFLVFIPQMHGLHWLLASNYLQHAHADGHSKRNFSRNFTGWFNLFYFNIGYHTAHHLHGSTHWSELPKLHERYHSEIDPRLNEPNLMRYIIKTYFLGLFSSRYRSVSLMKEAEG